MNDDSFPSIGWEVVADVFPLCHPTWDDSPCVPDVETELACYLPNGAPTKSSPDYSGRKDVSKNYRLHIHLILTEL